MRPLKRRKFESSDEKQKEAAEMAPVCVDSQRRRLHLHNSGGRNDYR
jgi:hypothetical protein